MNTERNSSTLRSRLISYLPLMLIGLLLMGIALYFISSVLPRVQAFQRLSPQLKAGQQAVNDRATEQVDSPIVRSLRRQIESSQSTLEAATNLYWTEFQVESIIERFYGYARDSGVKVITVQQLEKSGATASAIEEREFQLQAEGRTPQLINYVARIREAAAPSVTITKLSITSSQNMDTLLMTFRVYTSPLASGEVFSSLPTIVVPSAIPPTATTTSTPTATYTVTASPTATRTPTPTSTPTITPSPTETQTPTPTLTFTPSPAPTSVAFSPSPCADQAPQTMALLIFSRPLTATSACQTQIWPYTLDRSYPYVIEVQRTAGTAPFRLELRDGTTQVIGSTLSSVDGHGLLVAETSAGDYELSVVPLEKGELGYTISIYIGVPTLSFAELKTSYSTHTSLITLDSPMTWRYIIPSGMGAYQVVVTRTDGTFEYDLMVFDGESRQIGTIRSQDGAATLTLTTGVGTYYATLNPVGGTSGSYQIGLRRRN